MKILLSNKFYYPKGGDCVYSLELEKLLRRKGHEVAFFAMDHSLNLPSLFKKYFPSTVEYSSKNIGNLMEQAIRPVFSVEVKKKFNLLLNDFQPDIVHVNNIHSQISPIIVREAFRKNIPVVWTLHDQKLLCPRYDGLLEGKPCDLCYHDKKNVIRHKCLKGSLPASLIAYMEAKVWNKTILEKFTSKFICPSNFIKEKMIKGGYSTAKLEVLHNFIDETKIASEAAIKEDYYCYVGRLSKEKGVDTLCEAAVAIPEYKLILIGTGPEEESLKSKYNSPNILFLGHQKWEKVREVVSKAKFMVLPSICFENNPLSIIEALSNGTPVIGSNIGGIPELIIKGKNGELFQPGNVQDLQAKIRFFFSELQHKIDYNSLIKEASNSFSASTYYERLIALYGSLK